MGLIYTVVVGGIAGWLAGQLTKGKGFGVIVNIILGIVGSWVGTFLLGLMQLHAGGMVGELAVAVIGAVILVWIVGKLKK